MRISDWSSDVCSSDLTAEALWPGAPPLDVPPRNALIPEPPRIDLNATPILPERPAPSLAPPPDADAVASGRLLAPIVGHTRQTTLAAIVLLDRNGIVVGGDGGSLATLPEVRAALAGEPETVLRRNASYRAVYRFEWL